MRGNRDMACGCGQKTPDLGLKQGIRYGEKGLDLITCTSTKPYRRIGDYTGFVYAFDIRASMYVDKRDSVYIIGDDFRLEG